MSLLHPTAIIDSQARIDENVKVGPYAIIEANVNIGPDCEIAAHAVIKPYTRIGTGNYIAEHAIIGGDPQDTRFKPADSYVLIGDHNSIREGVTIHRATAPGVATCIGNNNYVMAYAHIAHECKIGDHTVFANGATLGGHVEVGDRAFLSGYVLIHQFCRVGQQAMVAGLTGANQDCLPYMISMGIPARTRGLNLVGLKRAGINDQDLGELKHAYRLLFLSKTSHGDALDQLRRSDSPQVRYLAEFIETAPRGYAHAKR